MTAASYKINLNNSIADFSLEPLVAYRAVKGFTNIFDAGLNFKMDTYHLDLQAIYRSNQSMCLGFVFEQESYALNFAYNIETGELANYTNGAFEFGRKLKLF
jgi:hypothetical protein